VKFLCEQCKAKYQIADEKAAGKTVRMKCRKCGYLIEVRAAATDPGASAPTSATDAAGSRIPAPPTGGQPAAPRQTTLATSLASAKSPSKPSERTGPLASALKSALQREDEVSAPVDMSDLSPNDEWYVAINGVPVGPIRIGEVRRKAAIGAVTDESLCWQEGLDEWRPLRAFPDLAALVREAFIASRSSMTPAPPEVRTSVPSAARPPFRSAPPASHPAGTAGAPPRPPPRAPPRAPPARAAATPPPATARSNVVPFTSRLATAEKLAEEPQAPSQPVMGPPIEPAQPFPPSVVDDPSAPIPPSALVAKAPNVEPSARVASAASPSRPPGSMPFGLPSKRTPPWIAIAMVAAATAFGVTAALSLFLRPASPPGPVATAAATASAGPWFAPLPSSTSAPDVPERGAAATAAPVARGPVAAAASPKTATGASATASHGPLDLHSLTSATIAPTEDPGGGDAPKAAGQCLSEGQVQQVIGLHSVGLRRACWERSTTQKASVNVAVSLSIGPDGSAQGVSTSGDDPSVASCIASDVRNWRFPAMGCSQRTAFSFHFVRQ
jgi:predicted Zn finger-like uncharacterized protein